MKMFKANYSLMAILVLFLLLTLGCSTSASTKTRRTFPQVLEECIVDPYQPGSNSRVDHGCNVKRTSPPDPLFQPTCGSARPLNSSFYRNKNGILTKPGQFPYFVQIGYYLTKFAAYCSGFLISDRLVLTAAHCLLPKVKSIFVSVGGLVERDSLKKVKCKSNANRYHLCRSINSVIGARYDIGLLKLSEPVEFNENIQPVCLPTAPVPVGLQLYANGLENQRNHSVAPSRHIICPPQHHHESTFCAQPNRKLEVAAGCPKDSGSPLVGIVDGRHTVFGVVSYGDEEDCKPPEVTIFANVYNMRDDINKMIIECS